VLTLFMVIHNLTNIQSSIS